MEPIYALAESTVKPLSIEVSGEYVFLRKDITSETRTDMEGKTIKYWIYQEAVLTSEEFNLYANVINADNTAQLIDGQKTVDNNQLAIMEAFADMYDLIASGL